MVVDIGTTYLGWQVGLVQPESEILSEAMRRSELAGSRVLAPAGSFSCPHLHPVGRGLWFTLGRLRFISVTLDR